MSETETRPTLRPRMRAPFTSATSPQGPMSVEDATGDGEAMVPMIFPKEVVLTNDLHDRVRFPAGLVNVPASLADHWYLKASGVKRVDGMSAASPA